MQHSTLAIVAFVLIVIGVYVAAHSYIYFRMKSALEPGRTFTLLLGLFFISMIFSPFIIRFAENKGFTTISTLFAYVGYTWMGIMSIMVLSLLFFDALYYISSFILRYLNVRGEIVLHLYRYAFLIAFTFSLIASAIGYFEAKNVRVNKVLIESRFLPEGISPLRVAQISDLHISQTLGAEFVSALVKRLKELDPDLIVITGDITDIDPRKNRQIVELFKSLKPRYGKYSVTGNHEFYAGIEMAKEFYEMCEIRLLRGEFIEPVEGLVVAGVDDDNGRRFGDYVDIDEERLFESKALNKYVILLKHKPFVNERTADRIDLQLSGHVHGGQIFPFSLIVRQVYRYFYGLYPISDRMWLYVSRGTGYWGPPMRFFAPPEIAFFEIKRKG